MTRKPYIPHVVEADQILPGLYQGSRPKFGNAVAMANIDVLVLTAKENSDSSLYTGVNVLCVPGDDDVRLQLLLNQLPKWRAAALEIAEHVTNGRNVLVTCMQGLNRSGFVTALTIHFLTGWSGKQCVAHVKANRPGALFNRTFTDWLCTNVKAVDRG